MTTMYLIIVARLLVADSAVAARRFRTARPGCSWLCIRAPQRDLVAQGRIRALLSTTGFECSRHCTG